MGPTFASAIAIGDEARPDNALVGALLSGGDARLAVDPATGLNCYGCAPAPRAQAIAFSSSTASTISPRAFAAAEVMFHTASSGSRGFERAVEVTRADLGSMLDLGGAEIVFAASGTDCAMLATAVARAMLGGDITSIVAASDETGNGVGLAAAGRHFNSTTSGGRAVVKGEAVGSLSGVETVAIPANDAGCPRRMSDIDADVSRAVTTAIGNGKRVALHVMHHSKLGTRCPSHACVEQIRAAHSGAVQVIVDACQFRLSRSGLRSYLEQGFIVLITGSKFFNGPPLSGAMLLPEQVAARVVKHSQAMGGLSDYSSRLDWPQSMSAIRDRLPVRDNVGQLLRWTAALEEMRAYYAVPELFRRIALAEFGAAVSRAIALYPGLQLLPEPEWTTVEEAADEEFGVRTIFPFTMRRGGDLMSCAASRTIFLALNENVGSRLSAPNPRITKTLCHLGQPVSLAGSKTAALRISADARYVSDCHANGRFDTETMRLKLDQLRVVFEKTQLLLQNLDALSSAPASAA